MRERGHLVGHQADAIAAVDTALWDLAARIQGVSVISLLGGAFRDEVPTYVSGLPRPDDDGRAALALDWFDRGATAVKLHLGHGVAQDLRTVDAIQAAAPAFGVAVDAHWAYSLSEALTLVEGLAARGAAFLEAPLRPRTSGGTPAWSNVPACRCRRRIPAEPLRVRAMAGRRSVAGGPPDVARTGITELMAIAELMLRRARSRRATPLRRFDRRRGRRRGRERGHRGPAPVRVPTDVAVHRRRRTWEHPDGDAQPNDRPHGARPRR